MRFRRKPPAPPTADELRRLGERLQQVCGVTSYGSDGISPYEVRTAGRLLIQQADELDRLIDSDPRCACGKPATTTIHDTPTCGNDR